MISRRGENKREGLIVAAAVTAGLLFAVLALTSERAQAAGVLVRQDATLTTANRPSGMPTTSAPGRHLSKVTIEVETYGQDTPQPSYFVDASVELAGSPGGDPDAELNLGFGNRQGDTCNLVALLNQETSDYSGSQYTFTGYNPDYFPSPTRPWDCVAVFLDDSFSGQAATNTYDALIGSLKDTRHSPQLKLTGIDLLGQKLKKLKLVPGVPTKIGISFRNSGKAATGKLTIKGAGKGLKVKAQKAPALADDRDGSATLTVRLRGRQKRSKLRIVVGDGSVKAVRTLRVIRARAPRRPIAGSYRSRAGDVTFTVKRGRITGWYGHMTTRCGGFPDNFTYSPNSYSFRTVKVPRNGIVQATEKGDLYTASLRLRIAGRKATRGQFVYYGPDRCFASVSFTAKRTGR